MKKQIAKIIGSGILASFLAGTIFMIAFLIIIDMQTPNHYEDGRPKMNCFGGLQYGIAIGIQILIAFLSLPAFLILFKQIRKNKYLIFLAYFAGYFLYLTLILVSLKEFSGKEYFIIIPWINFLVWIFYYFKLRKAININE
ncbi:hypothetical protein NAL32_14580 [Chryseobacterium sp. Ch-15]|uniref:Uncharacterized protein n=1 Tax=Chryseobacterium muglaense TaxID=2893752 RepID=A0A9Q3URH7_9FLAO|nr:hypothetical protein [Chryseobacterium muglaense]MBD3905670.1 hypothetical protein [Chryseobacterium muglaense]MCC9034198.1 hypothetical protein [Chryseobacterium muglaense]MCM2555607.1 hypothetical protein [Chryseobacterium muglaense]